MKSGKSMREIDLQAVNERYDDLCDTVEWVIRLIKDGETRENVIEALMQFERKLLK